MRASTMTGLLAGMQLTDSALPTGAFAHSFGFESYLEADRITDADGFAAWLESFVDQQLTFADALAIRLIYAAGDMTEVFGVDQSVTAQALPAQVREAGMMMGRRLLTVGTQNYPSPRLDSYARAVEEGTAFSHPRHRVGGAGTGQRHRGGHGRRPARLRHGYLADPERGARLPARPECRPAGHPRRPAMGAARGRRIGDPDPRRPGSDRPGPGDRTNESERQLSRLFMS